MMCRLKAEDAFGGEDPRERGGWGGGGERAVKTLLMIRRGHRGVEG